MPSSSGKVLFLLGLLLSIACTGCWASEQQSLHQQLQHAYSIRVSNPEATRNILDSINPEQLRRPYDSDLYSFLNAHNLSISGDPQAAITALLKIIDTAQLEESRLRAYAKLISSYVHINRWEEAIFYGNLLSPSLSKIRTKELFYYAIYNLSNLYLKQNNYQAALNILADYPQKAEIPKWRCILSGQFAEAKVAKGGVIDSKKFKFLEQSTKLCFSLDEKIAHFVLNGHLAAYFNQQGLSDRAIELLSKDLSSLEVLNYPQILSGQYTLLQIAEFNRGNLSQAAKYGQKILALGKQGFNPDAEKKAYQYLAKIAEQQGHPQQALDYYRKYQQLLKAEFNQRTALQLAILNGSRGAEIKQHKRRIETLQDRLQSAKTEKAEWQTNFRQLLFWGLLAGVAALGGLGWRCHHFKKQLKQLREQDRLTGVANRIYFRQQAHQILVKCRRSKQSASLILLQLEQLKAINHGLGYEYGDQAIQQAIERISSYCLEHQGIMGRMSGAEFAILLPNQKIKAARALAEHCHLALQHQDTSTYTSEAGAVFRLQASLGITDTHVGAYNLESLFRLVENAIEQAEAAGGNQIIVAESV